MSCGDQPLGRFGFPKLVHPIAQWLIPSVQGVRTGLGGMAGSRRFESVPITSQVVGRASFRLPCCSVAFVAEAEVLRSKIADASGALLGCFHES